MRWKGREGHDRVLALNQLKSFIQTFAIGVGRQTGQTAEGVHVGYKR